MKEKAIEENDQLVKLRKRKLIEKNKKKEREKGRNSPSWELVREIVRDTAAPLAETIAIRCGSSCQTCFLLAIVFSLFSASPLHFSDLSLSFSLMAALQLLVNRITSARWYLTNTQWPAVHSRHPTCKRERNKDSSSAYHRITFLSFCSGFIEVFFSSGFSTVSFLLFLFVSFYI